MTCTRCGKEFARKFVGQTWCQECLEWSMEHVACLSEISELRAELARLRLEHGDDAYLQALRAACRLPALDGDGCLLGMPDSWVAETIARMRQSRTPSQ
ncbi:MAG: hypothetical protein HY303_16515 [Candidatus Wallbacteria bacterium]|nr:hypothetical protein [Candidatus Wallbacteria bacterium]